MNLNALPIWSAYIIIPALLLVSSTPTLLSSPSPITLAAIMFGIAIGCAAIFHLVMYLKSKLFG